MYRPRCYSERELEKAGVELANPWRNHFRCLQCGEHWFVCQPPGDRRWWNGYWHCPRGCNCE